MTTTTINTIKFMYNGIKFNNQLYKGFYSIGQLYHSPSGTITIYAKDYKHFPKIEGLNIENETDSMTDYFDDDKFRVTPDNKLYKEVYAAYTKQEEHNKKAHDKRLTA